MVAGRTVAEVERGQRAQQAEEDLQPIGAGGQRDLGIEEAEQAVEAGDLLDQQGELTFLRNVGENLDVSVAVMGTGVGFAGAGDLWRVADTLAEKEIPVTR